MNISMSSRVKIGSLFVNLTAKLYGGEPTKNEENNPDIINWERNQVYESKTSISSDHHKLNPSQIKHYQELQKSEFPLANPEVYYFLWQHKKRGISKLQGNELEKTLTHNINRLLILSFDIIEAGTQIWDITGHTCFWGEIYMLRSSERTTLTKNTQAELTRMRLNPKDFSITQETIQEKTYKYKWWDLPEFTITNIQNKKLKGVKRIK